MDSTLCIIFDGYKDKDGYGILPNGKRAHRQAYLEKYGKFNEKLHVCHKCDNPPCVNPDHLFLGTTKDNMMDKARKGRSSIVKFFGEENPMSKLTREKVLEIKDMYHNQGFLQKFLAKKFGVSQAVISDICRGKTWK